MNIVKSIKVSMALKGVKNQKALSELSGVSEMTITKVMAGRGDPSVETVERLSNALGYKVSEFYALGE